MIRKKKDIRQKIKTLKKAIDVKTSIALSQKICTRLIQTETFQQADCIAIYYAMEDEVQTSELIEQWYLKKKIVLPVISGEDIHFYAYTGEKCLTKSTFGILEPTITTTTPVPPEQIDLFIVPGVAFDRNGNRLGRGKGYYDRYLANLTQPIIGLCFDFQLLDHIPTAPHDKKMTAIITESAITNHTP